MLLVLEAGEQAGCPDALGALFMVRLPDGVTVNVTGAPYGSVTCKYEKAPKSVPGVPSRIMYSGAKFGVRLQLSVDELQFVPEPTSSMKGMCRFCTATLPEYSPAAGSEPERVTVKVEVAPGASVVLERAAVMLAPGSDPGLPLTVQQETFGADSPAAWVSVTVPEEMFVTVTVF